MPLIGKPTRLEVLAAWSARRHPGAWWLAAVSLVLIATIASQLWLLLLVSGIALGCALLFRGRGQTALSLRFFVLLAGVILLLRVAVRLIFSVDAIDSLVLLQAATDGFRLVAILLATAMAVILADSRKLLKSAPRALGDLSTAATIALNLAPEIAASFRSVKRAARLRGSARGLASFASIAIPAIEAALDSALGLAASMEARGFGFRETAANPREVIMARISALGAAAALLIGALQLVAVGLGAGSIATLAIGVALTLSAAKFAGGQTVRTRVRATPWAKQEWFLVIAFGLALAAVLAAGGAA